MNQEGTSPENSLLGSGGSFPARVPSLARPSLARVPSLDKEGAGGWLIEEYGGTILRQHLPRRPHAASDEQEPIRPDKAAQARQGL